jgi:hypothetical protein
MAPKITSSQSGPIESDPSQKSLLRQSAKVEVVVTPNPKTRKQMQANAKAERLSRAQARQEQNVCAPRKQNESQRTARRKRDRDMYHAAAQSDLAAGRITAEQAKEHLTKRRGPDTADV